MIDNLQKVQISDPFHMTPAQAQSVVSQLVDERETERHLFYIGDHWQDMKGWVGPVVSSPGIAYADFVTELRRSFIFYNACREVVNRHVNAILAKPPQWGAALERVLEEGEDISDEESAVLTRIDEVMAQWWNGNNGVFIDDSGVIKTCTITELLTRAASRAVATSRSYLRMFIPPKYVDDGRLELLTLEGALSRIRVELCDISSGALYVDPVSIEPIGVYVYKDFEDDSDQCELTYLGQSGMTILFTRDGEIAFSMNGLLLHHQLNVNGLLQDSVLSQQKDLNRTLTMSGRNMDLAGFPERVLLDGMLPGDYEKNPVTGKKTFIPDPFMVGAGSMNVFNGITYKGRDGEEHHISPSYQRLDPVGSAIFDKAIAEAQQRIRDEVHQSHVAMSSDATASGRSREQARHEFTQSLLDTENAVENAIKWMLTAAIWLGIATSNESPALMDSIKFNAEARIATGPVNADDRAEDRAAVKDGVMSRETAITRIGIDDVGVERARIENESDNNVDIVAEKANVAAQLIHNGAEPEAAYSVAGFADDQVTELSKMNFEPTEHADNDTENNE